MKLGEGDRVIQAVIFDMDGLLVDSEPVWFRARVELLARFGKQWTESDQEPLMGVSTSTWVDYVTEKLEGAMRSDEVLHTVVGIMAAAYESGDVPLLPGASEALQHCVAKYRVGLASGSPKVLIDAALTGAQWHRYFEEVVSSDECARGKPAPDVYIEILRRMGLTPETTAIVEDSAAGILAGKAAAAKVVAVPGSIISPDNEALNQADARLASLHELPSALEQL
ncbi:MAG: HAD family phosphatase [Gemmatimonadota bacterium]|nr:MAG: HAD family phosphatase [Gemmatimonadota bacterium]